MKTLQFFYENPPKQELLYERKLKLQAENSLIKGSFGSGKKSLVLNYLNGFEQKEFLFLDFEDLRFDEASLMNLESFLKANPQIHILILCNLKKNLSFKKLSHNLQIICTSSDFSLHLKDFKELWLDFLDFEEFISMSKNQANLLGAFLHSGRLVSRDYNTFLRSHFKPLELEILKFIALNLGMQLSINELYKELKNKMKISKDLLYKSVAELEKNGVIYMIKHSQKNVKKVFFADFGLKNALCIQRDFKKLFANLVFCELLKLKENIFYSTYFDFYLPNSQNAIILAATLDPDLVVLRARKIIPKAKEMNILHVIFLSLSNSKIFYEEGIKFEILPFEEYALGF